MPRCKLCKEKFETKYFLQKYCMIKDECIKAHVNYSKEKKWKETKAKMKADLLTLEDYKKITQQTFNLFIRLRDSGLPCISCGRPMKQGNIDAGHLWSAGGHGNIRFNEYNVNAQCSRPCNKDLSGDANNYRIGFIKKYSAEKLAELDSIAHIEKKYTIPELKEIREYYKLKIKEML